MTPWSISSEANHYVLTTSRWTRPSISSPPNLHCQIFKSFYTGYQAVFRSIAHILSQPPTVPTPSTINSSSSLDPATDFYFRKGGKVEYALACLMSAAEEQSGALGDGTFEESGLVRMNLRLDPKIEWGPYPVNFGGKEVGMDSDSD